MNQQRAALGLALILISTTGIAWFGLSFQYNITMDTAVTIAEDYLSTLTDDDLAISEIMEFESNFYVVYYEESTGIGAMEMLIDKATGRIFPEYGPNMMWNTKYGHGGMMGNWNQTPSAQMSINQTEALTIAQAFLDTEYPGTLAEDVHPFYGYYTIHVHQDGTIIGMLSVHGEHGEVWYHNWHGEYIQSLELHED
jgi:hypothetical protein